MKQKIYILLSLVLLAVWGNAQTMKVGVRQGSVPNSVVITIQPGFNFNNKLNEMGFTIMIPKENPIGTPIPIPTVTVLSTCATCLNTTFPAANWVQVQDASDPNFYYIKVGCVSSLISAPTLTIGNGAIQDAVELRFQNSTITPAQIRIAHIASGGPNTQYGLLITDGSSNDLTNYKQMFFGVLPADVVPLNPYGDDQTGYDNTQYVTISNITLPVNWLSFDAIKNGHNGILNWKVSDEETNKLYELQRSLDGVNFAQIATINKTGTGSGVKDYTYTDPNIDVLGVPAVYYRLKQVNYNGGSSLSEIRMIRLSKGNGEISVFPNPAVRGFYVNVPLENPGTDNVKLVLISNNGQVVQTKTISAQQASNYYFDITPLSLAVGQYQLRIALGDEILKTVKLIVNKE